MLGWPLGGGRGWGRPGVGGVGDLGKNLTKVLFATKLLTTSYASSRSSSTMAVIGHPSYARAGMGCMKGHLPLGPVGFVGLPIKDVRPRK